MSYKTNIHKTYSIMIGEEMKIKKTIYLSKEAEEKLKEICKLELRSQSNTIDYIIIKHKPETIF